MRKPLFNLGSALLALVLLCASPAHGLWWVQDELGMGPLGFSSNSAAAHFQKANRFAIGLGHSLYGDDIVGRTVHSGFLSFSKSYGEGNVVG